MALRKLKQNIWQQNSESVGETVEATIRAEEYFRTRLFYYKRIGLDEEHIPPNTFSRIPKLIQKLPDYLIVGKTAHFVVVVNCSYSVQIKECEWKAYNRWHKLCPIYFFIYDVVFDRYTLVSMKKIGEAIKVSRISWDDDNDKIFEINLKLFFRNEAK